MGSHLPGECAEGPVLSMDNTLPPSASKVQAALAAAGLDARVVVRLLPTRTAEEAAAACGCAVAQIVKSLVFRGAESQRPYLFLVSGKNRVIERGFAALLGERLERPDADFVRLVTGYAIGGIPPLGLATAMQTLMDQDLLAFDTVWAAAGTPNAVFPVAPAKLQQAAGARLVSMT